MLLTITKHWRQQKHSFLGITEIWGAGVSLPTESSIVSVKCFLNTTEGVKHIENLIIICNQYVEQA